MNTYVVVRNYAYEGETVLTAGNDWNALYEFAKVESQYLAGYQSRDSIVIYTFTNGIEVDSLEL